MLSIFSGNSYSKCEPTAVHADAKLALHIVLYLQSTQNKEEGAWLGSRPAVTLRQTCHALEALHLLRWKAFDQDKESGAAWLVNLSDTLDSTDETRDEVCLNPSRFKTLAWLNDFNDSQIITEFTKLSEHLTETGLLEKVSLDATLASMIYVDCVCYLEQNDAAERDWLQKRNIALAHVEEYLRQWGDAANEDLTGSIDVGRVSNASYALDLLLRMKRLQSDDPLSRQVRVAMIAALRRFDRVQPVSSDVLYCAIQLASHFQNDPEVKRTLEQFLQYLREKYDKGDVAREDPSFHPLVLRTLLSFHGEQLHADMVSSLLDHERQNLNLNKQSIIQERQASFVTLVRNRVNIELTAEKCLTGGLTDTPVYRADFFLTLPPVDGNNNDQDARVFSASISVIIKSGNSAELLDTIRRYRELPDSIKLHFAKHSGESIILGDKASATAYLILEDLTSAFSTFRDIFSRIDLRKLKANDRERLGTATQAIADALRSIYEATKQNDDNFFGPQLARLYISPIERALIRMSQRDKYPHLKSWMTDVVINGRRFPSIEYYLGQIERHRTRLTPHMLMLTHGDCHSRNIMLDENLVRVKLIDLDKLDRHGDYILDYASLLEDIAVFCFLFDEGYTFRLKPEDIKFPTKSDEPDAMENRIAYPPFSSTATRRFQEIMMEQIKAYATKIDDEGWKERLWLALATHLLKLVAKAPDKKRASVLYAEAVQLLHTLVSWLDYEVPLPDIPFSRSPDEQNGAGAETPFDTVRDARLKDIHKRILALDESIEHECNHQRTTARYFLAGQNWPFVVIDGEKRPARILLAVNPNELQTSRAIIERRKTQNPLQTVVHLRQSVNVDEVMDLVADVRRLEGNGLLMR